MHPVSALLAAPLGLPSRTSGQGGVCWSLEEVVGRAGLSLPWPFSALALGGWQLAGGSSDQGEELKDFFILMIHLYLILLLVIFSEFRSIHVFPGNSSAHLD